MGDIKMNRERIKVTEKPVLTDDIIADTLHRYEFKPLSKEEEKKIIKKLKLSFYDNVDSDRQKIYLEYYLESYPKVKQRYDNILDEIEKKKREFQELSSLDSEINIDKLKEIRTEIEHLERKKERLIDKAINNSKEICNWFISNNQRLVVSVLGIYKSFGQTEDLYMEGNLGMLKALERFDIDMDAKFSTYATWWIKERMSKYIKNKARTIRFPINFEEKLYTIKKIESKIENEYHRKATVKDIAENSNFTEQKIENILKLHKQSTVSISLNERIEGDIDEELASLIAYEDNSYESIEEKISNAELLERINKLNLPKRTIKVLKMTYGLDDGIPKTRKEIGEELGLSRERVRQIEKKGIMKIKMNPAIRHYYYH